MLILKNSHSKKMGVFQCPLNRGFQQFFIPLTVKGGILFFLSFLIPEFTFFLLLRYIYILV